MTVRFDASDLALLRAEDEIEIETSAGEEGPTHRASLLRRRVWRRRMWAGKSRPGPIPATTYFIRAQFFDNASGEGLPEWVAQLPAQPTTYVTLGTEVNGEPELYPSVMRTIIEGLRDAPLNLIVTLGRDKDPADFGPQPPNVHIERYIPQTLLLPHCDLMVLHAGSNSLLAALDAGLPLVLDTTDCGPVLQRICGGEVGTRAGRQA